MILVSASLQNPGSSSKKKILKVLVSGWKSILVSYVWHQLTPVNAYKKKQLTPENVPEILASTK